MTTPTDRLRTDRRIADEAERRHGLVTRADLATAGMSDDRVDHWVSSGRLARVARGVYRIGGVPMTTEAQVLAAILVHGPDTWASHRTAAWLWGMPGFGPPGRIEVVRTVGRSNARAAASVRRTTMLPDHHRAVHRSVPVTSLARTLFDLAGSIGELHLDRTVEAGLRTRWCSIGSLFRVTEELGGRGRRGSGAMRAVLERRGRGYVPTESELDLLGRAVVAPLAGIEWQVPMSDEQGYIRRVDGLHRSGGLVIEWDGSEFHDTAGQAALDVAGDRRLEALGLAVVRYRWGDVTGRPAEVREEVAERIGVGRAAA